MFVLRFWHFAFMEYPCTSTIRPHSCVKHCLGTLYVNLRPDQTSPQDTSCVPLPELVKHRCGPGDGVGVGTGGVGAGVGAGGAGVGSGVGSGVGMGGVGAGAPGVKVSRLHATCVEPSWISSVLVVAFLVTAIAGSESLLHYVTILVTKILDAIIS